jgi:hypothetical protein
MVTVCTEIYVPDPGLKVGVEAVGVPDALRATITFAKVSATLAVAVAV